MTPASPPAPLQGEGRPIHQKGEGSRKKNHRWHGWTQKKSVRICFICGSKEIPWNLYSEEWWFYFTRILLVRVVPLLRR